MDALREEVLKEEKGGMNQDDMIRQNTDKHEKRKKKQ